MLAMALAPMAAFAVEPDTTQPVLVEADGFGYDVNAATVMAVGNVEVIQGEYIVFADRVIYNQNTGVVQAEGNVSVAEPTGNVFFANNVELKHAVKTGVIKNFRARLNDNALFAAKEARKINDHVTEMDYGVYSGCKVCNEKGDKIKPLWQMKAKKITYDEKEQTIAYNHARMEVKGVPVLYTPYFVHAAPGADRKSGILIPSYSLSGNLGARLDLPYYWNIAPNMDATITPIYTSDEGPVLAGEFRHLLKSGFYELGGSITRVDRIDDSTGIRNGGYEYRGHVEGIGHFKLSDFWEWGFDAKHTSDDTYLRRYEFSSEDDLLTSRAYLEGYEDRTFVSAEMVGFQGLRSYDDSNEIPFVLPLIDASHETDAGWHGSRMGVSGNIMALTRDLTPESRRVSTTAYWRLPHVTSGGHVFEMRAQMRTDLYSVDEQPVTSAGLPDSYSGLTGRVVPEVWVDWKYPLLKRLQSSSITIEPVVNAVVGMNGLENDKIPNEDSYALEFSDANVFSANHYPGYDLVESGNRVSYGVRSQWAADNDQQVMFLFGQNYHTDNNNLFPYSNDLNDELSDYVGRLAWSYADKLYLAYRFRLGSEDFALNRSEIESRYNIDPLSLRLNYVKIEDDPYLDESEEIRGTTALQLNDQWTWIANARRDLTDGGGFIRAGTGLVFQNECVTVSTSVNRQYIRDRDIEPATSVRLELFLKNLN